MEHKGEKLLYSPGPQRATLRSYDLTNQMRYVRNFIRDFASGIFPGHRGRRYLLMLNIYMDDSGTHGGPYCFLAGYLASAERWADFSENWMALCQKYLDGRAFHSSAANRTSDPGYVPEEGLVQFAQCICKHAELEIWAALPEYYAAKIQEPYGVKFDRYRTCFLGVIEKVITDYRLLESGERLAWIFDHHGGSPADKESELESSLIRAFRNACSVAPEDQKRLLHAISFVDDEHTPPLQAADFLAWHKRRRHADGIDVPERAAYEVLRASNIRRIEVVWFDHKLEELLDHITNPN